MKIRRRLAAIAVASYTFSFFLPAFDDLSGFQCFLACWALFIGDQSESIGTVIYYGAFVPTNVVFVIACIYSFRTSQAPRWAKSTLLVATVHVLSWCVLSVFGVMSGSKFYLGAGYLLWLAAFLVCVPALMKNDEEPNQALQTTPVTRSEI